MSDFYTQPKAALRKIEIARAQGQPVFIYGATGFGKTAFVRDYLSGINYTYVSCNDSAEISINIPNESRKKKLSVLVFDDIQLLGRSELKEKISDLTRNRAAWVIMISRGVVPEWLARSNFERRFMLIEEHDLALDARLSERLMGMYGIRLSDDELHRLVETSEGNGYAINRAAEVIQSGVSFDNTFERNKEQYIDRLMNDVAPQYAGDLSEFVSKISVVDKFTVPLAKVVTGFDNTEEIIRKAVESANFFELSGDTYRIKEPGLTAIRKYAQRNIPDEELKECAYRAGEWYEQKDIELEALKMYEKANHMEKISGLLIKNAKKNPGNGHFYEMRKYYYEIPEDEIKKSIQLMTAMAMLNSLLMDFDSSEYWCSEIDKFAKTAKGEQKREAIGSLAYLDIAMPHRESNSVVKLLANLFKVETGNFFITDFSITNNMPSIMTGGKDFSDWSLRDTEIAAKYGKPVSIALGKGGVGLVNEALGESFYEKGHDYQEVLQRLSRVSIETDRKGKLEIAFAAVGITARLYIVNGELESARELLTSFRQKAVLAGQDRIVNNIDCMFCRAAIYDMNMEVIDSWLADGPGDADEFFLLHRYTYMTKIEALIATGRYMAALELMGKMQYYAEVCHRPYIKMKLELLAAIIDYRTGHKWEPGFASVMRELSHYHFVAMVAEQGAAVFDMLMLSRERLRKDPEIGEEFVDSVYEATQVVALKYPQRMNSKVSQSAPGISTTALRILKLQAGGCTVEQIAEQLGMKVPAVKYHIRENYKKLNAKNKAEAITAATGTGLL